MALIYPLAQVFIGSADLATLGIHKCLADCQPNLHFTSVPVNILEHPVMRTPRRVIVFDRLTDHIH